MTDTRDFFVSFTRADVDIATAINDALRDAGFSTWFHPTDKPKGAGIADWMEVALDASNQMLALCSDAYFDREKGYSRAERQSMFWEDPTNNEPLLILVKVADCKLPRLIAQNEYISLTGLQRPEAAAKLVAELQSEQARIASAKAAQVDRSRAHPAIFNVQGGINPMFTGRDAELALLHDRVRSGTATAITAVKGMGGVGKTSLAREYAHRFGTAARFGGVWWIEAETETGILAAYERLAGRVEAIGQGADQRETAGNARDWLGQQGDAYPWLVIFDNAPDAKTVAPWLPRGSARVIITSRYEHFEKLATQMSLEVWDEETTTAYLMARRPGASEDQARSLAQRLGGLPLAAEYAGAYLSERPTVSFKDYEDRLVAMLGRKPEGLSGDYPLSVFQTFAVAIDAVAEREEGAAALGLLNLCAFLSPDGVELDMLTATAEQTDILPEPMRAALADSLRRAEALRTLTAYSLARLGEDTGWGQPLILHRLIAEVARARLEGEAHALWAGAAVGMIGRLMPYDSDDDPSQWPLCARMLPHSQALLELEPETGGFGAALLYVLNQSAGYLIARGDTPGATDLLRRVVELGEVVNSERPLEFAAHLGNLAGQLAQTVTTWDEAGVAFARALKIKEAHLAPDDPSLAITLSNFGGLQQSRKAYADAVDLTERVAEIDKAASGADSAEYAIRLNNLSAIYYDWANDTGDPALRQKEREFTESAAAVTRSVRGMRHPEAAARFNNIAVMHATANDLAQAANDMAIAVAIDLSLDQMAHPVTQTRIATLLNLWAGLGQSSKAERLRAGDGSGLFPIVERIEAEHRAWVAEDPDNRHFGPPSPVTGATE